MKEQNEMVAVVMLTVMTACFIGNVAAEAMMTNEINTRLDDIFDNISPVETEENPEKTYDDRFKELEEKIDDLNEQLTELRGTICLPDEEEDSDETYTETIIFAEKVSETEPETDYSKERLPVGVDTNRYDCEHYTFGAGSDQHRLQSYCYTDENGLRYFLGDSGTKYYCVAMGGAYGIDIGDTWFVTLECGTEFGIMLSDFQHPITEVNPNDFGECYERDIYGNATGILRNYDGEPVIHVLEFIVDMNAIPSSVAMAGTVSALDEFGGIYGDGGNIIDISYNGRLWSNENC